MTEATVSEEFATSFAATFACRSTTSSPTTSCWLTGASRLRPRIATTTSSGRFALPALNSAFDALYPPGDQWYWRSDYIAEIPDEAVAIHADCAERLPRLKSTTHLYPLDRAAARVAKDATAFSYRDAHWVQVMVGVDPDPANIDGAKQRAPAGTSPTTSSG